MTPMLVMVRFALVGLVAAAIVGCTVARRDAGFEDPENAYGAFLAARYAGVVRDAENAADFYRAALEVEPDNPLLVRRAFDSALAAGQIDQAVPLARPALELSPEHRLARVVLASHALRQGRYERARVLLEGHSLGPLNRVIGPLLLAWSHAGLGDADAALAALEPPRDAPILGRLMTVHRALILERFGRDDEAERAFLEASDAGVLRAFVVGVYGERLERARRLIEARALYQAQLSESPDDPIALAGLARIAEGREPPRSGPTPAQGAALAVFGPAAVLAVRDDTDLAAIYLHLALYLDAGNDAARYYLGDHLRRQERYAEARAVLLQTPPDAPYFAAAAVGAALTLVAEDRADDAAALLEDLVQQVDDRRVWLNLGFVYRFAERFEEGGAVYARLIDDIEGEPTSADWHLFYHRGVCLERTGRWPEAEANFQRALELSPDHPEVLNYLGYSWVDRGENLDEAFALIRRAVQLRPDAGFIVDSLGWAYYKLGRYEEAVTHLERAVELDPQEPTINDHLGDAYWRVGRRLEAVFQWRRALSLDPEDGEVEKIEIKLASGLPDEPVARLASPGDP